MDDKIKRMKELIPLLSEAAKAYYQESREIMSNFEYDKLYDELSALEAKTGIILSGSPTQQVGYQSLASFQKRLTKKPMLSLDKTKSVEDLQQWFRKPERPFVLENGWSDRGSHLLSGKIAKSSNPWEWSSW